MIMEAGDRHTAKNTSHLERLSPHSLSRRTRDLLAGDLSAHCDLLVDPDPETEATVPESRPVVRTSGPTYGAAEAVAAMERLRRELEQLAGITDVLTEVERRADEAVEGQSRGIRR